MQIFSWANEFKWFALWSQGTLQGSVLNRWSSQLERFPSLLYILSLHLPRDHSAQFITTCSFNIRFIFLSFSSPPSPRSQKFMQLRNKLSHKMKSIVFHNPVSLSATMTKSSNLKSGNHFPQDSMCLDFMDPRRWTTTKPFWTALILRCTGVIARTQHSICTEFLRTRAEVWELCI